MGFPMGDQVFEGSLMGGERGRGRPPKRGTLYASSRGMGSGGVGGTIALKTSEGGQSRVDNVQKRFDNDQVDKEMPTVPLPTI